MADRPGTMPWEKLSWINWQRDCNGMLRGALAKLPSNVRQIVELAISRGEREDAARTLDAYEEYGAAWCVRHVTWPKETYPSGGAPDYGRDQMSPLPFDPGPSSVVAHARSPFVDPRSTQASGSAYVSGRNPRTQQAFKTRMGLCAACSTVHEDPKVRCADCGKIH